MPAGEPDDDEASPASYMDMMSRISTPCIRVCILDPESGLCEGCGRTAGEIGGWGGLGEPERLAIMAGLEDRMRRAFLPDDEVEPMGSPFVGRAGA